MDLCFSTNLHSCALCEAAWFFSLTSFRMAASGEPAAITSDATSWGPELCDPVVTDDIEETVESMDAVRCAIIGRGSTGTAAVVGDMAVGEVGGEAASMGAEMVLDWLRRPVFLASSLNASLVTTLRISSSAGLLGAFLAGLGARTRSTGSECEGGREWVVGEGSSSWL